MITINCETKDSLAMEELTEFQGELKHREESDIKKIAASIIKHGFAFPFFVWSHDEINWEYKRESIEGHTTPKPIELISHALDCSSKQEDIVLDLFGGSGSTLIACEKTGRKARLMELDPKYCDVIRRRYTKWAKENNKPITSGCLE